MMIPENHPVVLVGLLRDRYGDEMRLTFSRYFYRPRSVFDEREIFEVPIWMVSDEWLEDQLDGLEAGWEIALNSLVVDHRGRKLHIPMIDFIGMDLSVAQSPKFSELIGRDVAKELILFDSGRSAHAYSTTLLSRSAWVEFMGRLLLLNIPGAEPLIDTRWVGHRLISGYAALRWSFNTRAYTSLPSRIDLKR